MHVHISCIRHRRPTDVTACDTSLTDTLNLHMDDVVVVLDAVLDLTAVDSCVTGPQPRYFDARIGRSRGVSHQMNSVQVVLANAHLSFQGH